MIDQLGEGEERYARGNILNKSGACGSRRPRLQSGAGARGETLGPAVPEEKK